MGADSILYKIVFALICAFFIWWLFRYAKADPKQFSKEYLGKSFYSIGVLGIILFAAIAVVVSLLNSG